ncbi:short-chain dehydrogenase/reductase [Williamsia sp. CHRR-6]|uniref:short-chain dehydrogenase/reductase n=1 Tax=Williamsia sp. CHRR-6 TaxID=2835871 RepID=UPI001BDB55DE|nr:short-chain dehydrogenase/reductase [Williamsia sp. CHRR-6]MBT0568507.1 SDR family NAD(P)-dependent oxidoreductase [Williamsia sp. CHRR-6]
MSTSINGKVVVITGGASGIGAATAHAAAARGAHVVLLDREDPHAVAATLPTTPGSRHLGLRADVTDSASLLSAVEAVIDHYGCIDVVVANAGVAEAGTVAVSDVETLARTVEVNLTGLIRTVHATLEHVCAQRGYFLLVSSAAALKNVPGGSAYAASKAGVEAFGGALRLELAHRGVGVGVAHPAWIRTPMYSAQNSIDAVRAGIEKLPWPFGVVTDVGECADAFVAGIEARSRKIYVPAALAAVDKVRGVFTGRLWDVVVGLQASATVPALEREIRALRAEASA